MGKTSTGVLRPDRTGGWLKTALRAALMLSAATLATGVALAPAHAREYAWKFAPKQRVTQVNLGRFSTSKNARLEAQPPRNCMISKNSLRNRGVPG